MKYRFLMTSPTTLSVKSAFLCAFLLLASTAPHRVWAQEGSTIPDDLRGQQESVARGVLDGNLIETNYRNIGELSRWQDNPYGVWPRGSGGRHIDGIAIVVAGLVRGNRPAPYWPVGTKDTLLDPVSLNYRGSNIGTHIGPRGDTWGWLPLPGFHNPLRIDPVTGQRSPVPAVSTDPDSWPASWPDRLQEEDAGWSGSWNGIFGKGVFNADAEGYYVMDDLNGRTYQLDPVTGLPYSDYGLFYPTPSDSTKGGLGLQVKVRILQWSNVLAEDSMFLIYRITNLGQTDYGACTDFGSVPPNALRREIDDSYCPGLPIKTGLFFTQFVDYGLGNEEGDETAAFNPQLDIAYGWDQDGIGTRETGGTYDLGYTGFAFLESPSNDEDGQDNDEDGITDELRFGGPGSRIEGQDAIRSYVESSYDMNRFETKFGPIEDRPAYQAGVWWTGDEDMDWVGYEDNNENGQLDAGELLNDDYGRDGLGPYDLNYPGPDEGEADGMPTLREPNFDQTDVDESDQIGLTGFHLAARTYYQPDAATNLIEDSWMWARISENQFPLGQEPGQERAEGREPFLNFSSGPVGLAPNNTNFFSTAWIFGDDEQDFFKNRETVQNIYDSDYRFAQPPTMPTLEAEAGDGYISLSWDTLALATYDRFTQCNDFEGFKLYKGTDELLSDARTITDVNGTATFYDPLERWDLADGITGNVPVLNNTAIYNLGSDTGLKFNYVDDDVTNGKTYYYALVAYDSGSQNPECQQEAENEDTQQLDPQENTFNVRNRTPNVAVVTPRSQAAGYTGPSATGSLSQPMGGIGTGSIDIEVVNSSNVHEGAQYRLAFFDTTTAQQPDLYETTAYSLHNLTADEVLIPRTSIAETTPTVEGFVINIRNDEVALSEQQTGWQGTDEEGETVYSQNPGALDGDVETNWAITTLREDTTARFTASPFEYELQWTDSTYTTPGRAPNGYLEAQELPFTCRNVTLAQQCDVFIYDRNDNGELDMVGDTFVIADAQGFLYRYRYQVGFTIFGQESDPPDPGATLRISTTRPFSGPGERPGYGQDAFTFTMRGGGVDTAQAKDELQDVSVVPNPYVAAAGWEPSAEVSGRGPRKIQFTNLPQECTVRIYTMRGELVRTLRHEGVRGDGAEWWDLKTRDNQEVAYGIYFYHVSAPGVGETTGKFAIVK